LAFYGHNHRHHHRRHSRKKSIHDEKCFATRFESHKLSLFGGMGIVPLRLKSQKNNLKNPSRKPGQLVGRVDAECRHRGVIRALEVEQLPAAERALGGI